MEIGAGPEDDRLVLSLLTVEVEFPTLVVAVVAVVDDVVESAIGDNDRRPPVVVVVVGEMGMLSFNSISKVSSSTDVVLILPPPLILEDSRVPAMVGPPTCSLVELFRRLSEPASLE